MRLLSIDHVKENMRLARSIYSADGHVLLAENILLTDGYIQRLKEMGITSLYIIDKRVGKIEIDELVKTQTRLDAIRITKEAMSNIHDGKNVNGDKIREVVNSVMEELILSRNIMYNMIDIRAMNDYHFSHNVTVCILALMTGVAMGYNFPKLKQLGVGAILHDAGKAMVPDKILNKKEQLTPGEYAEIQKHTRLGYDILSRSSDITSVSAHVALDHHERFDGSGYPAGLKGTTIHEFSRIVAIADVYDALSTDRVYRKRLMAHEVIEYIRDTGRALFDPEISNVFLKHIAPFPIGCEVLLNNGEKGVVVKTSKDLPARPVVKVILDHDDNLLPEPFDIDLRQDLTVFIVNALKDGEI